MKSKLFLIAFLLLSAFGFAQNAEITGTVNEAATGLPMPGVNITVKDATISTVTDIDGNFSISVPSGSTLVFSFIGFNTQERVVNNSENLTISLTENAKTLDEVVLIGYGSQKRREVTGAVGVVDNEVIEDLRPVKIEQALQGTVSGVNVTTQSGAPGAGLDIRIRGIGTNGDAAPLVLIDGNISSLSDINFTDIESITVLKDAQTAIYGAAGANGVVLVKTKQGRKNTKLSISYNGYIGMQETTRKLPLLNATEYALLLNEAYANNGQPLPFPNVSGLGRGTDWQDQVFDKGVPIVQHDITMSGGGDKVTYSISGSHLDQDGIVGGSKSHYDRNTFRIGMTADLLDNLKLNTNVIYTDINRQSFNENVLGSVLFNAINTPAIYSPYDANGDFTVLPTGSADVPGSNLGNEIINPLAQIANTFNDYDSKNFKGVFELNYDIITDLTVTGRMGFDTNEGRGRTFSPQVSYGGKVFDNVRSRVDQNSINDNSYTFDAYLTYKKMLAEAHNFTVTLGTTVYKQFGEGLFATGFDVPNNSWEFADIGLTTGFTDAKTASSYKYDERRLSHFGRLQYDYKGRYLVSAMLRRDTSTKFGPENRVAYFPSVTGGWIISDEPFYGESAILNFAKLRASYGLVGNDRIGDNGYVSLLNGEATYVIDGQLVNGTAAGVLANPFVQWEEARKFDVGADLRLFSDKLEIVADYFVDTRNSLLVQSLPVSDIVGTGAPGSGYPTVNAGNVRNSGLELGFTYKDQIGEDFNFRAFYNVTFIKNEVTEINGTDFLQGGAFGVGQPAPVRMQVGEPLGYFYGYQTDGIFQNQEEVNAHPSQAALGANAQPGDIRFVDVNGDGVINADDRTNIGDPIPDATMGLNLQLEYKGIDFTAFVFASLGNDMVRNYERNLTDINRMNYVLDRWTGPGTSNSVPRVTTGATSNNVFSDYYVEDASYCRIQNVQLGYTISPDFTKKAGIDKLRVYAGVNNLYTFTKYRGFDPGASSGAPLSSGIDYGFYPVPRTYMFGVNVKF
ncbi:TonB-dependent receptor [Flavobacterium coralii]|uniref:SusC/RagA family TonB-linked outer membrane protein n=1 Tax=Flavobacterium coralii TaxID=2838017 RepID=UPI000C617912|nr:SusC/RagA family protein [Flavobacterium sp.]|tara:strand:+ start:21303 stop:24359 length:3057 start_codon:yes stop_codon:yes gene_type:complete